jgi:hypothetical protein
MTNSLQVFYINNKVNKFCVKMKLNRMVECNNVINTFWATKRLHVLYEMLVLKSR